MKKILLIFAVIFININLTFSQGNNCASAVPFCSNFCFPNNINTTAPSGPSYGCVLTQPNPEWFFIKTTAAGVMTFTISQHTTGCASGAAIDVDFVCWGPFASLTNACNTLTGSCVGDHNCTGNIADCSYSIAGTETMTINSPGPGNYYMIMITNYANLSGFINIVQNSGPATDCSVTCPSVTGGNGFLQTNGTNMPATVACNTPDLSLIASNNTPFGNPITPAIIISFTDNTNASNWIQWYENGTFILCDGPAADGCGIGLTIGAGNDVQFSTMSPSATNNIVLCENNTAQPNMPYTIIDAASGATINTGTWLDDGACQTISFPPGTITGVASWSVSPACPGCLVNTTDWGFTQFSPSIAGAGTWNICYSFDPPGACPTYTYCQSIVVTNPYVAAWTAPAAICANSGLLNLNSLLNVGTTAGGTWSGTGVSGTNFDPSVSGPGTFSVTYSVGAGACSATQSHNIIVNPVPVATATPSSQTLCSGSTTGISLSSSVGGTTYAWTVVQTNVSGASNGSGSSIAQVLTATSTSPGTAVYTITPTAGGCVGSPITVTITVNPKPVATATPSSQTICSGGTTGISLTSNVAGTTFAWTVVQTNVSGASAGSGTSIAQTLSATTTSPGSAVYTVTPTAGGCSGTPITVTITVNPTPIATATPSSQIICSGSTTGISLTSNVAGTTFAWTVVQTNVSGASASSGTTIAQALTATSTVPGTAVYTITPTAGGCPGTPITVTITVNPKPVATATPASQTICSGGTTGISLTSNVAGTTFAWTVVQTNVSGATAGSGSSIAQTLTATSTSAGTAVYTITPTAGGCSGTPITVTITVNPTPVATATPSSQTICSGTATSIALTSTVAGTTFTWTVVQTNVSGASASSGSSIAQTLTATSIVAGTAVYTITPTAGGCPGTPITVTITVNPSPVATATPSSQTICSGSTTGIALTSNVAGTTFAWTVVQTNVSGATAGSGTSIAQTLTATSTVAGTAVYTITPTAGGCSGTPITVTITVNPKPVATATPSSQTICSGATTGIALTSNVAGTTFSWTVTQTGVTGATAGSGSSIAQVLTATGTTAGSATYTITPSAGGCTGTPISVTITVNPTTVATATPTSQTLCSGSTTGISLSGSVVGTTFAWTVVQTNVSGATAGSGTTIAQALTATAAVAGTAVYTITPTANGCPGAPITVTITVNPKPVATATPSSQTFCTGGTTGISLTSTVAGTTFTWTVVQTGVTGASAGSGSSIAQTLSTTGAVAGTAVYTITPTAGGCTGNPITVTITVNPKDNAAFTYGSSTYCQTGINPTPTITGLAGGIFTATPAGLSINAATGTINLSGSSLNTYTVTYTTSGICPNSSSVTVTITSAPSAGFSYPGSPFCQYSANPFPTFSVGASAGTFSAVPAGLVFVNVNTGQINLSTSTPGTYTVTNSIAASGGCAAATATSSVTIIAAPVATATPAVQTICS
ncbi:MAG: beta strand repeat-containing protein, partial [Bacteroidia bacterium]